MYAFTQKFMNSKIYELLSNKFIWNGQIQCFNVLFSKNYCFYGTFLLLTLFGIEYNILRHFPYTSILHKIV